MPGAALSRTVCSRLTCVRWGCSKTCRISERPSSRRRTGRPSGSAMSPRSCRGLASASAASARPFTEATAKSWTTTMWSRASCCCGRARKPTPRYRLFRSQGPRIRLGRIGKAIHRSDGKILDDDDVVEGIVLLRKGAEADATLQAIHEKVDELNHHILPKGVQVVPFLDRSNLVHYTTHTVLHNLTEGIILVVIVLFLCLGNARGALKQKQDDDDQDDAFGQIVQ